MKKIWPVPNSYTKEIPKKGQPGSFWENRGDRFHSGVDIYAPENSEVLAIEGGKVIEQGIFTSPEILDYWHKSYFVIVKTPENIIYKYAELSEIFVNNGDIIEAGTPVGKIALVLNKDQISHTVPDYIIELIEKGNLSMLHLEIYMAPITEVKPYQGGNFFGETKPYSVLDPGLFLNGVKKRDDS